MWKSILNWSIKQGTGFPDGPSRLSKEDMDFLRGAIEEVNKMPTDWDVFKSCLDVLRGTEAVDDERIQRLTQMQEIIDCNPEIARDLEKMKACEVLLSLLDNENMDIVNATMKLLANSVCMNPEVQRIWTTEYNAVRRVWRLFVLEENEEDGFSRKDVFDQGLATSMVSSIVCHCSPAEEDFLALGGMEEILRMGINPIHPLSVRRKLLSLLSHFLCNSYGQIDGSIWPNICEAIKTLLDDEFRSVDFDEAIHQCTSSARSILGPSDISVLRQDVVEALQRRVCRFQQQAEEDEDVAIVLPIFQHLLQEMTE